MDDLISRRAAIDALMSILDRKNHAEFLYTDEICKALGDLPSAQPEIIYCKDCYHYPGEHADCPLIGWGRNENDFCSYAERRTDDQRRSSKEIEERICVTEYVESSYVDCVDIEALRIAIKALEQPEIVRCKDCKHYHYKNDIPYCDRIDYGYGWKEDDFCSRAERRTDD